MESVGRFLASPERSFFLFGPRGTGKTTWLKQQFPDALRVDLLEPDDLRAFSAKPERLRDLVLANPDRKVLIIDEVQRLPDLLSVVHALIESDQSRVFVLTGSSARKLKRTGVDLLAGRAVVRNMHPFMAAELGDRFDLTRALKTGLVPIVEASDTPQDVLNSYVGLYIREEVMAEGLVRNVGAFARFLESMAFAHASMLNIANVARECQVERKVAEGYVGIMEDLLLGYRLPVFTKRAQRALVTHPKFYFFDAGIYRSLRATGPLDRSEEIDGHALVGLLAQHLRAWIAYSGGGNQLFFWRTRHGVEIDFVVYGASGFWALEVKNADRLYPADTKPLRSFLEEYPECRPILLYRGKDRLMLDGVLCVPCADFLRQLHPNRPLMSDH